MKAGNYPRTPDPQRFSSEQWKVSGATGCLVGKIRGKLQSFPLVRGRPNLANGECGDPFHYTSVSVSFLRHNMTPQLVLHFYSTGEVLLQCAIRDVFCCFWPQACEVCPFLVDGLLAW